MLKNGGFSHFYRNPFIIICYFFVLSLVSGVEKNDVFAFFWENSKMAFWPKLTQIWLGLNLAISGYIRPEARVLKKMASKILKIFYFFFYYYFFFIEPKWPDLNPFLPKRPIF